MGSYLKVEFTPEINIETLVFQCCSKRIKAEVFDDWHDYREAKFKKSILLSNQKHNKNVSGNFVLASLQRHRINFPERQRIRFWLENEGLLEGSISQKNMLVYTSVPIHSSHEFRRIVEFFEFANNIEVHDKDA